MKSLLTVFAALSIARSVFAAAANEAFPTAPSVKGLQVQMVDDAIQLGVHHAVINLLCRYLAKPALQWQSKSRPIILSEQRFHSEPNPAAEQRQAAAYAVAWEHELAEQR